METVLLLPDIETSSNQHLTNTVRAIVDASEVGRELTEQEIEGHWLMSLLKRHHMWTEKQGVGVNAIKIVMVTGNGWRAHKGLVLSRIDGSTVDISWREAIRTTPHKDRVRAAMRAYIEPQIAAYKAGVLDADGFFASAISGERCHIAKGDVDHAPPRTFKETAKAFFAAEEQACPFAELSVVLAPHREGEQRDFFEDVELAERWCEFHRANAELRLITKLEHKQLSKRNQ